MKHQPVKKWGQNFLRDTNLLKKIVKASDIKNKNVIEIGPGQGALTVFLAQEATTLIAYEIDTSLKPILDQYVETYPNLTVIYQDFLEADLSHDEAPWHVVANVPYYITTPILFKLISLDSIRTATLMMQKEVAERLMAQPKTKAYNALSVILSYHAITEKVMDVKRHMFYPVPNVDSVVLKITKRETPLLDQAKASFFIDFVKGAFRQKRKTLVNNLHQSFAYDKAYVETKIEALGFPKDVRAEALRLNDFIRIAEELKS